MSAYLMRRGGYKEDSYSTNFSTDANPLNEVNPATGVNRWRLGSLTGYYKNPRVLGGKCFAADTVTPDELDDCLAQLLAPTVPAQCRIAITTFKEAGYTPSNSHENGIYGRMDINISTGFVRGYEILLAFDPGAFQVVKWLGTTTNSGNFTVLGTSGNPPAINHGDIFHADFLNTGASELTINCYRNGTLFNTTVDNSSPWIDGAPGMGFFVRAGGTPENYCITNWSANGI